MSNSLILRNNSSDFSSYLFSNSAEVLDLTFVSSDNGDVDIILSNIIKDHLSEKKYINILIPVSMGKTFSDFLGLRLASHIRCSNSINQFSNIFIYSFVGIKYLLDNECFNILNTNGTFYIDFHKEDFKEAIKTQNLHLNENQISSEISKLKLNVPDNYLDNHSITNLWSMYRWKSSLGQLGVEDKELDKIVNNIDHNLYFKYLQTINNINNVIRIERSQLKLNTTGSILYIDDEADKGWYEIFCTAIADNNGDSIEFDYIDSNKFKNKSQLEIIELCKEKVIMTSDFPDVIILDFRLHRSDFYNQSISAITGYKLLEEIKKINPGIQVIIFSATSKISNLQSLMEIGADGFIIKEGIENSNIPNFTKDTISKFFELLQNLLERKFLKDIFKKCKIIKDNLKNHLENLEDENYIDFIKDLMTHIKLIETSGKNINLNDSMTLDIIYINCYNFIEKFKKQYMDFSDRKVFLGKEKIEMNKYDYNSRTNRASDRGRFTMGREPYWLEFFIGLFIDYFEISGIESEKLEKLYLVKKYRNNYIHDDKNLFSPDETLMVIDLCIDISAGMKE